jgi:AcrR family transcriptional regulator
MPRLSRAESQEVTRDRLIDAAADVFATNGFAASSLEQIADRAGYSRGAVYSNFAGKDELFLAVMARRRRSRYRDIAILLRDNPTPDAFLAALQAEARDLEESHRWFILRLEFFLYVMRQPDALPALAEHMRHERDELGEAVAAVLDSQGIPAPLPVPEIAAIVEALDHGLLIQQLVDPGQIRSGLYFDALGYLLNAAAATPTGDARPRPRRRRAARE